MNEFKDMDAIKIAADMLRAEADGSWDQVRAIRRVVEDNTIREFEFFLKDSPSTFKLLAETTTDKERMGFFILSTAILRDVSNNVAFYELAGGKKSLIEYLNSIAHRISALESQNKLLIETIKELSKEK